MRNTYEIKMGLHVSSPSDWEPLSYGTYAVLVHAWRALDPGWEPYFSEASYAIAANSGVLFG
jgi:hypothetical protein